MATPQSIVYVEGEPYYAAHKAREVLGMTYSAIRNQVIAGSIKAATPTGKRQLYYKGKDVERLAKEMRKLNEKKELSTTFYPVQTRDDMGVCLDISQEVFGVGREVLDMCMSMIEINPFVCYAVRETRQIMGYIGITPLKPGKMADILTQTLPVKVLPDDVATFSSGNTLDLYLHAMAVRPDVTPTERRMYGARLVSGLIKLVTEWGKNGVTIGTIAARSNMPDGIRLLRHFGFTEIERSTPERRTFIINVKESGIPFIEEYKAALNEWRQKQSEAKP